MIPFELFEGQMPSPIAVYRPGNGSLASQLSGTLLGIAHLFSPEAVAELRGRDAHLAALAALSAENNAIVQAADGAVLNADEMKLLEDNARQVGKLKSAIDQFDLRDAIIAQGARDIETAPEGPAASFNVPTIVKKLDASSLYDLSTIIRDVRSLDELPNAYRDRAMRVVEKAEFPLSPDPDKSRAKVERLLAKHKNDGNGIVARRVIETDNPAYRDGFADYVTKAAKGQQITDPRRMAVLQSGSDTDGGLQLPFTIDPTFIVTTDGAASALREVSRVETITTKSWHPITTAGVTASYGTEVAAATDVAPTDLDDLNGVTPIRVKTFVKFTAEYQEDYGAAGVLAEVGDLIRDAKDIVEADKFTTGDGSGEPEGIIWKLDDDGTSIVARADFDLPTLDALTAALGPRFRTPISRATYMGNLAILLGTRGMGTAGAPANSIYDQVTGTLNGYRSVESSFMDDVWTANKEVLVFGDFSKFVIVDRIGLSLEYIPQVFDGSGDPLGQRGLYARWRNMSKVVTVNGFRLLQCNGS